MGISKARLNIGVVVLALLSLTNLLALISPRTDDDPNSIARVPIQAVTGLVLVLMWGALVFVKKHFNPVTRGITIFIFMIIVYAAYYFFTQKFIGAEFSPYIKTLTWATGILFFYEMFLLYGINQRAMRFYIITSILAVAKEILVTSKFESATLGAGDTASLPLLFIMPMVLLMFSKRNRIILLGILFVLVLLSLRRTSILAAVCCIPFIWKDLKAKLKPGVVLVAVVLFVVGFAVTWHYLGDAISYRFAEISQGGSKGDYGSGRSRFYLLVWDSWFAGDAYSVIFGNGLTILRHLLMRESFGLEHAHDDFLEIGYTFGLLGEFIWLYFLGGFWGLRRKIKKYSPNNINMFYIGFFSYMVIGLASGCILRITTISLSLTLAVFMYNISNGKKQKDALKLEMLIAAENEKLKRAKPDLVVA